MNDTWQATATAWGIRPTFQTEGSKHRRCPGNDGGSASGTGDGGSAGGTGDGSSGGTGNCGSGLGSHRDGCRCRWSEVGPRHRCPGIGCPGSECGGQRSHHGRCGCEHWGECECSDHAAPAPEVDQGYHDSGTTIGWRNPRRPGRHCGPTTGRLPGGVLDPCDFGNPPWNQWPGDRADLYLPFLFMRANPGDLGARPVVGPFWESPDILLLAGIDPALAPPRPPELGQTALAGRPNTLYAHVWNFGIAAAPTVVVEFYWCDPSLGIGPSGAHLIGATSLSLGARGSGRCHAVAKCPTAWVPTFVNGGHECLVVRVWDETSDGLGNPPWDATLNRHIAQRNVHVVQTSRARDLAGDEAGGRLVLPSPIAALTLKVGPLYGEPAQVTVTRTAPHEMPWLQLHTGARGLFPAQATATGAVSLSPPTPIGGGPGNGILASTHDVTGDDQQVQLTTSDGPPEPGQAHVYRVTASQEGQVFGGYTVVLLG